MSYRTTKKITLLVLIAVLTLCFSSKVFAAKPDKASEKEKPTLKHNPKEVIAKVGDAVLTREKVNWMQKDAKPEIVKKIADWWIETELFYEDAVKSDDMFKDEMDRYMFELQYKKMYVIKLVDHLQVKDFDISDKEAKKYYKKNKATDSKLQTLGQATFYHIECDTSEKAQEVLKKLKAGGDIKELAKTESIAKDAKKGGYVIKMGFGVIKRRFSPEIVKQIEKAKLNKFIGPLKNKKGKFEIISVESLRETKILSFEKARKKINSTLMGQKRKQYFADYKENLKKVNAKKIYRSPILDEPAEDKESGEAKEKEKK
ncbi:MAG: peptidyl-prolyl cis-trans isomerase [Planctomycetes bacterium]|nr:peptidyl-prolyl cis-trans isomerase [Planctomycetota bacterium]